MILFFHFICLLARYIVSNISKSISKCKVYSDDENEDDFSNNHAEIFNNKKIYLTEPIYENGTLKFFPPVYFQRYETVSLFLQDPSLKGNIRKVVDFGCSELGLFMFLKNNKDINEILEVDIDEDILQRNAYKAAPLTSEYLMCKATKPLEVYVLAGSIADYDDHLLGTDAVIAIELIEHLSEEAFNKMPFNIFHQIKPKLAIFTTPNADFNSLFPNFTGFRHEDHKFEWTRKEFYKWTKKILKQYPEYSVKFYGIGKGPQGSENLGCCTQMAVFERFKDVKPLASAKEESSGVHNYKLIKHFSYPVYKDERTVEEKILHEIQYRTSQIIGMPQYDNVDGNDFEIPLKLLKEYVVEWCPDDEEFRKILIDGGMNVQLKNDSWQLIYTQSESDFSDGNSKCDDSSQDFMDNKDNNLVPLNENWDLPEGHSNSEFSNFPSTTSVEQLESDITDRTQDSGNNSCFTTSKESCADSVKENFIKSIPGSLSQLKKQMKTNKNYNQFTMNSKNKCMETKKNKLVKSKIPLKKYAKETEESSCLVEFNHKNNLSYVGRPLRIPKSCSLDSCLENINCKPVDIDSFYLDFIPGGFVPYRNGSLSSNKTKYVMNDSGSSIFSSSLDKAVDSGYPFSFSPPDADLTPEQVDEIFTENGMMSRSTSTSSELDHMNAFNQINHHDLFVEDLLVENGDLANNNRDGEGNNVEGLIGQRLVNELAAERDPNDNMFFPEIQEFPPWLLNLVELAEGPIFIPLNAINDDVHDEGVVEDSSSDCNQSLDPEDIDFYFGSHELL